ncbi:MAG: multiheme c-type cytochrome, partial [Terriglobia bacterium]
MHPQFEIAPAPPHPKGWWPNEGLPPRGAYTGPGVCAECHRTIYEEWKTSQMAHAIKPATQSKFVLADPDMVLKRGLYIYKIELRQGQVLYSVTDGQRTLSVPLLWAFRNRHCRASICLSPPWDVRRGRSGLLSESRPARCRCRSE